MDNDKLSGTDINHDRCLFLEFFVRCFTNIRWSRVIRSASRREVVTAINLNADWSDTPRLIGRVDNPIDRSD